MSKKKKIILLLCAAVLLSLAIWTVWSNTALELNEYSVQSPTLPTAFDGFRIAHISDLHNAQMGKNNEKLITMLRSAQPDMIAITGDLIDSRRTDISVALEFAAEAVKIAPCYYVTGNHESRIDQYETLKTGLLELGVVVLENEKAVLRRADREITVLGINDPAFGISLSPGYSTPTTEQFLEQLGTVDGFTILLAHRPDLLDIYAAHNMDLVLSGHAHGGQARLPFLGGIYAPGQGLFPKYDAGLFEKGTTQMIVSRGIGNSSFPLRFNNPPEVVLITLRAQGQEQSTQVENVTIRISNVSPTGATVTIRDTNAQPHLYGEWYKLEREIDGGWQDVPPVIDNYAFTAIGYLPDENGEVKFAINWQWLYGQLPSGSYRLWKQVGSQHISVEFSVQ